MSALLAFFADLILFTFGLVVAGLWVIMFFVIAIEIVDFVKEVNDNAERES